MAQREAADPYGEFGSVPTVEPGGGGGDYSNARANPEQWAQGAQAVEKGANEIQGMINETLATNSETEYTEKLGALTGAYKSLQGMDAVNALPKYQSDVTSLRQQYKENLPPLAQHSFDTLALRHEGYAIGDANSYAGEQVKHASNASSIMSVQNSVRQAGEARSIEEMGNHLGNIEYQTQAQFQHSDGVETDPETGAVRFASTPAGDIAKQNYQNALDQNKGAAWQNYLGNMSKGNALAAYDTYQQHKDDIPGPAQTTIEQSLAPRVADQQACIGRDQVLKTAHDEWYDIVKSPQSLADYRAQQNSPAGILGSPGVLDKYPAQTQQESGGNPNAVSPKGALGAKQIMPATGQDPGFGVKPWDGTAKDNIRFGNDYYDAMLKHYNGDVKNALTAYNWGPGKTDAWLASGGDPAKLPAETQTYVNNLSPKMQDMAALQGGMQQGATPVTQVASAANPVQLPSGNQAPISAPLKLSKADWYRENYDKILQRSDAIAENMHPGDPQFQEQLRAKTEQTINDEIRQQELSYKVNLDKVFTALNGSMSNGKRPTSAAELEAISPEVAQAWHDTQRDQPINANEIENKLISMNARSTSKDLTEYGKPIYRVQQDIAAGKITSVKDLMKYLPPDENAQGDYLTLGGFEKARQTLETMQKSPVDSNNTKLIASTMKTLQKQVMTGDDGKLDPIGEDKWNQAYPGLLDQIEAAGNDPAKIRELTQPESPKYLGNSIKGFVRPAQQQAMDLINALKPSPDEDTGFFARMFGAGPPSAAEHDANMIFGNYIHETDPVKKQQYFDQGAAKGYWKAKSKRTAPEVPISQ